MGHLEPCKGGSSTDWLAEQIKDMENQVVRADLKKRLLQIEKMDDDIQKIKIKVERKVLLLFIFILIETLFFNYLSSSHQPWKRLII